MPARNAFAIAALALGVLGANAASAQLQSSGPVLAANTSGEETRITYAPGAMAVTTARVIGVEGAGEDLRIVYGPEMRAGHTLPVLAVRTVGDNVEILYGGIGADVQR
ncbi:MAG: hypothetical protein IT557_15040 [Alphaproteobacteria bacterium]|nr:hypothetical protein [Alphaproteobacteria bacterium]